MSRFKIVLLSTVLWLMTIHCNIPRDNILDPQNPESYRSHQILIEAFVNTENPLPYNAYILSALDSLIDLYKNQITVVEYHRDTEDYQSDYHLDENEILYRTYLEILDSSLKGVPDVFVNGVEGRIQGASSISSSLFRLQEMIMPMLTQVSHFTIEIDYTIENNYITPLVTLARLGNEDAADILLRAVLTAELDGNYHKRVVRRSVESLDISRLKHGEIKDYTLPAIQLDGQSDKQLVVYVTGKDDHIVYQTTAVKVE